MKVLFLDIDGVVNSKQTLAKPHKSLLGIDPELAFKVGKIILDTGCEVVLSSSWRHFPEGIDEVKAMVYPTLYGMTPSVEGGSRGQEIKLWLADHPEVTHYAILDDESDFDDDQPLFKTSWETGLTDEIAKEVTDYLNSEATR